MQTRYRRLGIAIAAVTCLFAVLSASALGAGKPSFPAFEGSGFSFLWENPGPNHQEIRAAAIANGAPTTLTVQYREVGASEWITAGTKEIGSGTEAVELLTQATPTIPSHYYEAQAIATNSYGTVTTTEQYKHTFRFHSKWRINTGSGARFTSSYQAPGTFKIEWVQAGNGYKLECSQEGFGEFGPEAKSESLKVILSGCSYYVNSSLVCHPAGSEYVINLDNTFYAKEGFLIEFCPGSKVLSQVSFPNRFLVANKTIELYEIIHPMTMTAEGSVIGHPSTVTSSSNWQLTGENAGYKFALAE